MPTIPVYSSSPISASKASGATPHTQPPEEHQEAPKTSATAVTSHGPPTARPPPPPAAAGSRPSLPVQTGMPRPTPTATVSAVGAGSPPAPQPGAVPVPPAGGAKYDRPPKTGESAQKTAVPMPPQVSYPPPVASQPIQGRLSTAIATAPVSQARRPYPTSLQESDAAADYSHPPGYQQDVHAADMTGRQPTAHGAGMTPVSNGDGQPGVWDTARKWAAAAGESLAAAESEVWKRINKD